MDTFLIRYIRFLRRHGGVGFDRGEKRERLVRSVLYFHNAPHVQRRMGCAMYCSVMQRPNYRLRKSYLTHYNVFFVEYILPLR